MQLATVPEKMLKTSRQFLLLARHGDIAFDDKNTFNR